MTDERKPPAKPGMEEVSPKFVGEAEAAASDPLLGIIREYHEADTASDRSYEALDEAEGDARKRGIDPPRWGLVEFKAKGSRWTLGRGEIEQAATAEGHFGLHLTAEQRDTYLAQLDEMKRTGIERYKEIGLYTLYLENERQQAECLESLGRVGETPAASVEGFAAKVLVLCEYCNDQGGWVETLARSAKTDAERLWQFPVTRLAAEDPVLALKREWEARYQLLDEHRDDPDADDSDKAVDPFYDRLRETECQILHTRATTPAGIAVKLVLWARLRSEAGGTSGLDWNGEPIEGKPFDLDYLRGAR